MELHQVRYYVALCKTLNFTRAAEACNVTQPALTRAIQRLEEELGGPLFQRERNLTQLTELGRLMRPLLEQTLAAAEAAKQHATQFQKSEIASLRIGLAPTISARLAAVALGEMSRRMPTLEVELRLGERDRLMEALLQGEIDAAFLPAQRGFPDRLNIWTLFTEPFGIACAADHPLARRDRITLVDLGGETLLGRRGCEALVQLRGASEGEEKITLRIRHIGDSEEQIQHLAAISLGVALVPRHLP